MASSFTFKTGVKTRDLKRVVVTGRSDKPESQFSLTRLLQAKVVKHRVGLMGKAAATYCSDGDALHSWPFHVVFKWTPQRTVFVLCLSTGNYAAGALSQIDDG